MARKRAKERKRAAALQIVSALPAETREAIAVLVENTEADGDICFDGESHHWVESVSGTLDGLASEIRGKP